MIEEAVREPPDLDRVPGGWRSKLEEWARCMWAAWDRHTWLPGATAGERIMDPSETGRLREVIAEGEFYGMQTFDQALLALYRDGLIGLDAATLAASNPHDFRISVQQAGLPL